MDKLIAGVWLVDTAIIVTLVEACVLFGYHFKTGRGLAPGAYLSNLGSGLCLMIALRSVLAQMHWTLVGLWLASAGCLHGADLWLRWRPLIQRHDRDSN